MRRVKLGAVIGIAAMVAWLSASASATGPWPVQVNTSNTTWSGADVVLSVLTGAGQRVGICRSVVYRASIGGDGAVTVPAGDATYNTCTFSGVVVTVTQVGGWSGTIRHLDAGGMVSVITTTLTMTATVRGGGCTFTMAGTLLGDWAAIPLAVMHNVLVNIPGFIVPALLAPSRGLTLVISGVTGTCAFLGVANGQAATANGSFTAAPSVNLAGFI